MIQITIDCDFINGCTIRGYDLKDGYFLNEIHEERIEVLKALETWVKQEQIKEYQRRIPNASIV